MNKIIRKIKLPVLILLLIFSVLMTGCTGSSDNTINNADNSASSANISNIPPFSGEPFISIDNNIPNFTSDDMSTEAFEYYGDLDNLGRCTKAFANVCMETMPTEKRGNIGQVKPTGWQTVKYDCVNCKYLYNRCHLIGYQLSAENANEKNLVTGTRYLNVDGMLPFENMVADYVKETGNHVLYRVTPVFKGDELVCRGVQMEAKSVEDNGDGVLYNVFVYNNQPGIEIDYATGKSYLIDKKVSDADEIEESSADTNDRTYIINVNSKKFHNPDCSGASKMNEKNKKEFTGNRDELIKEGYSPCGICRP